MVLISVFRRLLQGYSIGKDLRCCHFESDFDRWLC